MGIKIKWIRFERESAVWTSLKCNDNVVQSNAIPFHFNPSDVARSMAHNWIKQIPGSICCLQQVASNWTGCLRHWAAIIIQMSYNWANQVFTDNTFADDDRTIGEDRNKNARDTGENRKVLKTGHPLPSYATTTFDDDNDDYYDIDWCQRRWLWYWW